MKTSWTLTVEEDSTTGDFILQFPDDLLKQTGWKEDDVLEWSDNGDGTWLIQKAE